MKESGLISFFYKNPNARLGELVIDAVIKENFELKAKISEHPSESGASFCDHVSLEPLSIEIEGIISNTPMTFIGVTALRSLDNYIHKRSNDLAGEAFKKLEAIFAKREPICIATSLKEYQNMVLESLSIERGGGSSDSLHFRARAKQIMLATQSRIAIDEAKSEKIKPKRNLGKQQTKQARVATSQELADKSSLLKSLFNWGK